MRVADVIVRTPKWMAVPGILIAVAVATQNPAGAGEPSTSLQTEYLMTLHAPLAPPVGRRSKSDRHRCIGAGRRGDGPRIKGKLVGSAGDWLRVMPSEVLRQDVRGTIQTDTNDLIFVSYNSAIQCSKEQMDRLNAGEELKTGDCYFITAPTFETMSERYGWINAVQADRKVDFAQIRRPHRIRYIHREVKAGELPRDFKCNEVGDFILASLQGAILLSKGRRDTSPITKFKRVLFASILR